jgi:hypothetical protein
MNGRAQPMTEYLNRLIARMTTDGLQTNALPSRATPRAPALLTPTFTLQESERSAGVEDPFEPAADPTDPGGEQMERTSQPQVGLLQAAPTPLSAETQPTFQKRGNISPTEIQGRTVHISLPGQTVEQHRVSSRPAFRPPVETTYVSSRVAGQTERTALKEQDGGVQAQQGVHSEMPDRSQTLEPPQSIGELETALQALSSLGAALEKANKSLAGGDRASDSREFTPSQFTVLAPEHLRGPVARLQPAPFPDQTTSSPVNPGPQLVIGRLTVEVNNPSSLVTRPTGAQKVIVQPTSSESVSHPPSRISFGLGQM